MSYEVLESNIVYNGGYIKLKRDKIALPNGKTAYRDVVVHPGACGMLTYDGEYLYFVKQYRHGALDFVIEIPAGCLDEKEDPIACAARELQEELGFFPSKIEPLCVMMPTVGYCDEKLHLFFCTDLVKSNLAADDDEFLEIVKMKPKEFKELAVQGKIQDAKTLSAVYIATLKGII